MAKHRGTQGSTFICTNLLGMDVVIEFDYEITCDAIPWSYDEPSSPIEWETTFTGMYEDKPGLEHKPKYYLEVPKWMEILLEEFIVEHDDTRSAILKDLEEY